MCLALWDIVLPDLGYDSLRPALPSKPLPPEAIRVFAVAVRSKPFVLLDAMTFEDFGCVSAFGNSKRGECSVNVGPVRCRSTVETPSGLPVVFPLLGNLAGSFSVNVGPVACLTIPPG